MSYLRGVLGGLVFCSMVLIPVADVSAQQSTSEKSDKSTAKKARPDSKKKAVKREKPIVITNEMLEAKYGPSTAPAPQPAASTPAGAAEGAAGTPGEGAPGAPAKPHAPLSAEDKVKRIAAIEKELDLLVKRKLSINNPYLAGVTPATDVEDDGSSNEERLQAVEKQIRKLESELAKLRGSR